jgi:hypothetical protein
MIETAAFATVVLYVGNILLKYYIQETWKRIWNTIPILSFTSFD